MSRRHAWRRNAAKFQYSILPQMWGGQFCPQPPFQAALSDHTHFFAVFKRRLKAGCSENWLPHKFCRIRRFGKTCGITPGGVRHMGLRGSSVVAQGAKRVDTDGAEGGDSRGCAADQQESEGGGEECERIGCADAEQLAGEETAHREIAGDSDG